MNYKLVEYTPTGEIGSAGIRKEIGISEYKLHLETYCKEILKKPIGPLLDFRAPYYIIEETNILLL